jgi:hypothetical protein
MSYKTQPYLTSSCERIMIQPSWGSSTVDWRDVKLLNPWFDYDAFDYDANVRPGLTQRRIRWNAVFGIGLATVVSASIWTGIVMAVARIWK